MRRVVVTGLGAVTPLGVGIKQTWSRLLASQSGIISTRHLGTEFASLPSQIAGLVPTGPRSSHAWTASEHCTPTEIKQSALFTQYALAASAEALHDAGLTSSISSTTSTNKSDFLYAPLDSHLAKSSTIGICLGTGIGNLEALHSTSMSYSKVGTHRSLHPLFVPRLLPSLGASHISLRYSLKGPLHSVSTACTTGAHSIGDAYRFIQHGDADVMLAGGSESCIHPLAIGGFCRAKSLVTSFNDNPKAASRPFDKDRVGFVISEGAAVLVLEDLNHARERGADIHAEVVGYASTADAHHITAPDPSGDGAYRAMKRALTVAEIKPREVGYINAHATSTKLGDRAENSAIKRLFLGEHGFGRAEDVTVSSTKGALGHLLGAAGAIEAVVSVLAVRDEVVPPTVNLDEIAEAEKQEFNLDYVPKVKKEKRIEVAVSNSFGFGGVNACLVFRKPQ